MPINSESRAPNSTLLKMSRPVVSVPIGWSRLGDSLARSKWTPGPASPGYGARYGAKTAAKMSVSIISSPTTDSLFRVKLRIPRLIC
jgi:hypothetical protein